jgi:RNA polymerase sigma-70 factor (ECF subfamily)
LSQKITFIRFNNKEERWKDLTDEELMVAYVDGDAEAFEILYGRHKSRVLGFLMTKLRDLNEAEDVFQTAFTKLHNGRHKYRHDIPFLPWLFTITRNTLIDHVRKKGIHDRHITVSDEVVNGYAEPVIDTTPIQATFTELSKLNESQRQALELRFNQGLAFAEIAEQMQTSADNSRQLVSRAVRKLRTLMIKKEQRDEKI